MSGRFRGPLFALVLLAPGCAGDEGSVAGEVGAGSGTQTKASSSSVTTGAPRQPPASVGLAPGAVSVEAGPFTDRVGLLGLGFAPGPRPSVRGEVENTADVSELIILKLQADFYDAAGALVASGVVTYDHEDAERNEGAPLPFEIIAEVPAPTAASALVSVPQLVNE